ncbi:MAG: DUF1592 domain-containing protein [Bacteroidota bacterium]
MVACNKASILLSTFLTLGLTLFAQPDDPRQKHFWKTVRPILRQHCYSCHNGEDKKAGLNLEAYDFIIAIVRDGERFHKVMEVVENGTMPPDIRPPMPQQDKDTLNFYINGYLQAALEEKDPGLIYPRRLNNQEYKYAIQDLLGVEVKVDSIFPSDPSGGAGFDNQARVLYLSPLLLERYFETANHLIEALSQDEVNWRRKVPQYRSSFRESIRIFWNKIWWGKDVSLERPIEKAQAVLFPIATRAYRRFLNPSDKETLTNFFTEVYTEIPKSTDRFDTAIKETLKLILVSHHFIYRQEGDPDIQGAYEITNFELASRLSFFLWSSLPDLELLDVAYKEDLHDPKVLEREVLRMLDDPKAHRLGARFATQWLELSKLKDPAFQIDPGVYPEYNSILRDLMLKEVELYFNHVLLSSKNFLELLDSDYSFLNKDLAEHYGVEGIDTEEMYRVQFASNERGGILGMGGVLTATSLPTRTSPVLRGKWVLEQILGTPAPPPPPDVPELEASHDSTQGPQSLRTLLEKHRADPACSGCHKAMDPIGLGLENFDGIGRWRNSYGTEPIDPSGILKSGESFGGPAELRKILLSKKEDFAKNFSKKMLSFALGRSLAFKDTPTINHLESTLLDTKFNSTQFILELVKSYPFRYKKSDVKDVVKR